MDENLHDIDKLFREPIEDYEEMPSSKVWDAIDNGLDKNNVIQIKRKYNNLRRIAIALLLLLLGTVVYEIKNKSRSTEVAQHNSNTNAGAQQQSGHTTTATNTNHTKLSTIDTTSTSPVTIENNQSTVNTAGSNSGTPGINREPAAKADKAPLALNEQKAPHTTDLSTETATSSNRGQTVNAGMGANRNAVSPGTDNSTATQTVTAGGKNNKKKLKRSATAITIKAGSTGDDENDGNGATTVQANHKKSSNRKTSTAAKNPGGVTDEVTLDNPAAGVQQRGNGQGQLLKAYSDKAFKLPLQQGSLSLTATSKRISPDITAAASTAVAKIKPVKSAKAIHFEVMPYYAPQISFNRLEDDHHDGFMQSRGGRDEIKHDEPNIKSHVFGVAFGVSLGNQWSVETGIGYLRREIKIEPKQIYARMDNNGNIRYRFDCSSGYTYITPKAGSTPAVGDSAVASSAQNEMQYLTIPLLVKYHINLGKFSIVPGLGTAINFLNGQKIETEVVQGNTREIQTTNNIVGIKSSYFTAIANVAMEYNFNRRWAISLAPSGNFALSSINKDAAVKSYPNALGITAGIKLKF